MEGRFLNTGNSLWNPSETLAAIDLNDKKSIRALEKAVKGQTGLSWFVMDTASSLSIIHWKLLLPIRGGKIEIEAQSNRDCPTRLYGFQISEDELFMKALKQIEIKR